MPTVQPSLPPNYAVSAALLKKNIESVARGEGLTVLHAPVWCQLSFLQWLVDSIYRLVNGIDDVTEKIIRDSMPAIAKSILLASEFPAQNSDSSSRQARAGRIIKLNSGGSELAFQVSCINGVIKLDQLYHSSNTAVVRDSETLDIPLAQLKKECLQFYVQSEHDAGRVADLSDIDLNQIDTDGIPFQGAKIRASFVQTLADSGKRFSFNNTELTGNIGQIELNPEHMSVDKFSALQLIRAGADRQQVILSYINAEQFSGNKNIDMTGFDLTGVHLTGVDLQNVNFRQAYPSERVIGEGQKYTAGPIYDNNIFNALLDPKVRTLLEAHKENQIVLNALPAALKSEHDPREYCIAHFADFAQRIDQLHQKKIVLQDLNPKTIRLFAGKLFFVNNNTVRQAGQLRDRSGLARNKRLPVEMVETGITSLSTSTDAVKLDIKCDQYSFLITLMELNSFDPDRSSIYFGREVNDFADALVTTNPKLNSQVKAFLNDPAAVDLPGSLHDIVTSSRVVVPTLPSASGGAVKVEPAIISGYPFKSEKINVDSNPLVTLSISSGSQAHTSEPLRFPTNQIPVTVVSKGDSSFGISNFDSYIAQVARPKS